ncbi:MAG: phosphatidate cytidylyltransferase [Proteobacteria bacterium]|nr:phosphatidate cytidylyltransferase [Pseudomonadota bacterium]
MLKQRVITAVIALLIFALVVFVAPPIVAELAIAVVILAGAWEWSGFLGGASTPRRIAYVLFIAVFIALIARAWPDNVHVVLQISLAWWIAALMWVFFFPTRIPAAARWICGALVLVPLWAALVMLYQAAPSLLLFALLIVWAADVGAYFAGKQFGRVKLAPAISPGKTWEGVIGGLLLVVVLCVGRSFWFETNLTVLLPFCLAVAGVSIVGDLTVSMFKRTAGLKDSGSLFPGHGGILDRIDSISAAAPLFALGLGWTGLS